MNPKDYLPAAEIAREYNLSRQRISQLAQAGRIDVVRIGRALLVNRKSLERYLAKGKK